MCILGALIEAVGGAPIAGAQPPLQDAAIPVNQNNAPARVVKRQMSPDEKLRVIFLHGQGHTLRDIGRQMNRDHKTIQGIVRKYEDSSSVDRTQGFSSLLSSL